VEQEQKVAATIERNGLLDPGQRVVVAFSGGPDSTALVLLLRSLGYDVVLGHVDHGMRPGSSADARHCRDVAARLGLQIQVAGARVPCHGPHGGEAGARRVRYAALERMADDAGALRIATGHTLDDDAETVLLRLERGGYPLGIPLRRGRIVRPLLSLRRRETGEVCLRGGVRPLTDPTNADESIARNRIRHRVLPLLGDEGVVALAAVAGSARMAKQRRDAAVDGLMAALAGSPQPSGGIRLDRCGLAALPRGLREGVIRRCLESQGLETTTRLVRDVTGKVVPVTGASLDLPGGSAAWSEARELVVGIRPAAGPPEPAVIATPGRTRLPDWGLEVLVEEIPPPRPPRTGPWEALLDREAAGGPLVLRSRLPGDRYRPLGSPGERKLQDVLVDLKVPRSARDRVPLLTAGGRLAWVGGHRIEHRFRLTATSTAAVRVRVFPLLREGRGIRSMSADSTG
jgi:tRNA(Ile)-lysidine synthase